MDRYKPQWIQHNGLKTPLAKFIWMQLKAIYQAELTDQLKENRRKLTEIYHQLETTINIKPNINESMQTFVFVCFIIVQMNVCFLRNSLTDISTPIDTSQTNDEDKISTIETISQVFILNFLRNQSRHSISFSQYQIINPQFSMKTRRVIPLMQISCRILWCFSRTGKFSKRFGSSDD